MNHGYSVDSMILAISNKLVRLTAIFYEIMDLSNLISNLFFTKHLYELKKKKKSNIKGK